MENFDLFSLLELYCKKEKERAAFLVNQKNKEVLIPFLNFIEKKDITITKISDLTNIDIYDYYSQLKEITENNNIEVLRNIKIILKFLKYIEVKYGKKGYKKKFLYTLNSIYRI